MKFEWDETKNRVNIRKHGFDFADAEEMFRGLVLVEPDMREDYGELRWKGLGLVGQRVAAVVFTERGQDTIRVISLRKADHEERRDYQEAVQNGLEEN